MVFGLQPYLYCISALGILRPVLVDQWTQFEETEITVYIISIK